MDGDYLRLSAGAGLVIVGLGSVPAVFALVNRAFAKRQVRDEIYQDADGKSTPEAQAKFSTRLSKFLVLFFASIGLATSLAVGVLITQGRGGETLFLDSWFNFGAWGFFLVQAIAIASNRECAHAYRLGIYSFLASAVFLAGLLIQATRTGEYLMRHDTVLFSFGAVQILAVLALAFASFSIQRRPDVFDDEGRLVDRMYTVSAFSRFNYSWPNSILKTARTQGDLDHKDLGRPNHYVRAKDVSADWKRRGYTTRLWLSIARAHASGFALQWVLTFATSILNFAPQWVILQLLRNLENRVPGTPYSLDAWMWVFWLGAAIVVQNWVESYVFWLSWVELTIPIRSQLSALVFEKAMRRKDVKGAGKTAEAEDKTDAASPTAAEPPKAGGEQEDEDEAEALKKSKQGTVNLIGVDAYRVGDFAAYQNLFPGSLFKLIVSLTFLVSLLGWKPLLAGFSTMVAILPINIYFSKTYAAAQDRLMKVRDEKLAVVTEALQGIRQIKFSALEPEWEKKVGSVRAKELRCLWHVLKADTALLGCWVASPILLSAISLAVYAYFNDELTPSVAFVSLGVFKALEMTLSVVPELTTDLLDAWVSVNRLEEYLNSPDVEQIAQESDEIIFKNASIAWPSDAELDEGERFVLRDVNIHFPKGELSVISGKTGTGKSLLLAAILGEVDLLAGKLYLPHAPALHDRHDGKANNSNWIIPSAIAYVAQIPWIENASIKDNILFGLPFNEKRYQETVEVCALKKDLEILTDGEHTEIGANGINLSGGQKWRVTLARAMYSRAGILVFDDIFSAVDAHVGRHIFERCLTGSLAEGRTRILVTHHVTLCEPRTKYVVELGEGKVQCAGLVADLRQDGILERIKSHEAQQQDDVTAATNTAVNSDQSEDGEDEPEGTSLKRVTSKVMAKKFVEDESRERGAVRKRVYSAYLKASGGWLFWMLALAIFFTNSSLNLGRSWWLKKWTGSKEDISSNALHGLGTSNLGNLGPIQPPYPYLFGAPQQTLLVGSSAVESMHIQAEQVEHSLQFYLGIYVLLAMSSAFVGTARFFYIFTGSVRASRLLFKQMNFAILHAPLRWLDTVPVGRILNRFTADFNVIDSQLANSFTFGFGSFLGLWVVIVAGMFVSPLIVVFALALLVICAYVALHYLSAARPVKRLESNAKSPVFEQFGSALTGVATIRGFDKTQTYIERIYKRIDDYSTATWHLWLFNRWMGWRMACIGSLFAVFVAILILASRDIGPSLAGFALAFSLEFANSIIWMIRLYANVELNMNAAERIIEYTEVKTETLEGEKPPAAWPTNGRIEVDSLVVGYAPDLPPVLKGVNFTVEGRQRVGVVGRTGAGKSSLTLALFRFLEATEGKVMIDGIDISTIRLHDLRSRLAIIPQDPVLFSGTIRSNLDPFGHHTDAELRESLLRVHLISDTTSGTATPANAVSAGSSAASTTSTVKNANIFANLSSPISEGGLNLSQGQRQLLCLARAIVARPKVMVLDEATSAVDMHTDALIQRSIREEFTDATLVVIAHRLSTISDFDKILVLGEGAVCEYGTPKELWEKGSEGVFRGMCEESGEKDRLKDIVYGQKTT